MAPTVERSPTIWSRALVTGASSGIGKAISRELAARGVDLVLVARNEERMQTLADQLAADFHVRTEVLTADLAERRSRRRVEDRLKADPFIDLLVNNAGAGRVGPFATADIRREIRQVELNVVAPMALTRVAWDRMLTERRGTVLNVSSLTALQPTPHQATYGATKAFVSSFFEALHEEARGTPITVTTVMPGFVRTGFKDHVGVEGAYDRVPDRLWLEPGHVARTALAAAAAGKPVSVPGAGYRILAAVIDALPRGVKRRLSGFLAQLLAPRSSPR